MIFLNWLNLNLERILAAFCLAFIVTLISINVIMRYIFNASLSWGEEVILWSFIWFIWLAVSYGFQKREHIRITFIRDRFSLKIRFFINIFVDILILIFFAIMIYQCIDLMLKPFVAMQKSVVLRLPIPLLYASAPVGASLSSIRIIQHLWKSLKNFQTQNKGASS